MGSYHERETSKSLSRIADALEAMLTEEQREKLLRKRRLEADAIRNMLEHQIEAEKIIRAEREGK